MRKKQSPFEDLIDLIALLPWKIGIGLAVISYLGLHFYATSSYETVLPASNGGIPHANVGPIMAHQFAMVLQYLIPFACLLGALVSFIQQRRQKKVYDGVARKRTTASLFDMSWKEFELLVAEYFKQHGYRVITNHQAGPDGGIDIVAMDGSDQYLVQCKQWRVNKVGVQVIRELYGLVSASSAVGGFVVTAGQFSDDAIRFAESTNIKLISGKELVALIGAQQSSTAHRDIPPKASEVPPETTPACPICRSSMIKREAKRGANAGSAFWGCSQYPRCKGTRAHP